MNEKIYTKLSALVGSTFTVEEVGEHSFKRWNPQTSKMDVSNEPQKGYRKIYPVTTNKGQLDLTAGQLGQLLEASQYAGKADLLKKAFKVGSNGQTGMDIRYYFDVAKPSAEPVSEPLDLPEGW